MRITTVILLLISPFAFLSAQEGSALIAPTSIPAEQVPALQLPALDNDALLEEEFSRRGPGIAPKFAEAIPVDVRTKDTGLWEYLPEGLAVWRLRINSPGAYSINLGFTEYYMPSGGQMIIYDPEASQVMGPFSPADNEEHNQLWTPVFPGDEIILEVQLPVSAVEQLRLRLTAVNHDFADFFTIASGSCNLDAICGTEDGFPILDLYRDIIQSVAVMGQGGDTFCTGFLVNNTRNDCTPYFMTAYHCNVTQNNAPTVFAYWNYQNSYCRPPGSVASGNPGDGLLNNFNTGTIWRAGYQATDFTLLEFDDPIPESANAFFAGWSREASPPQDTLLCIHHPDGAEKRVTFSFEDAYTGTWGGGSTEVPNGNHLVVPDWTTGSTESGSSGAPLFNRNKQAVGQLHGGAANCNNDLYDSFGWFRSSWNGGNTPFTRLKNWLDPDGLNPLQMDGRWMSSCNATIALDDPSAQACSPGQVVFYIEISEHFPEDVLLSTSGLPAGSSINFSPNPAPPGSIASLTVTLPDGLPGGTIYFDINATDGYIDLSATASITISPAAPAVPATLTPEADAIGLSLRPIIIWEYLPTASWYEVEVALDPAFTQTVAQQTNINNNFYKTPALNPYTTYYYRMRSHNLCGPSAWTETRAFTTAATSCDSKVSYDLPKNIQGYANEYIVSELDVATEGTVASVKVTGLAIDHTYVGDLVAYLESPSGTLITLFDQPGYPTIPFGCNGDDMRVSLADNAALSALALESTCEYGIAIAGTYQPVEPLAGLIGEPINGTWKLIVVDKQDQDGGQLLDWGLEFCSTYPTNSTEVYLDPILACSDTLNEAQLFVGYGFQDSVSFNIYNLPNGITIEFEQQPAAPGSYVDLNIIGMNTVGNFAFILNASDGYEDHFCNVPIEVIAQPIPPLLITPDNESPVFQEEQFFSWSPVPGIDTFMLSIARDFALTDVVHSTPVTDTYYQLADNLSGGVYFWNVASVNHCGYEASETFSFYKEASTVATQEEGADAGLRVFPNPASSQLYIKLQQPGMAYGNLYSPSGAKVSSFTFQEQTVVEVSQLPSGLYLLQVQQGSRQFIQRIVISY